MRRALCLAMLLLCAAAAAPAAADDAAPAKARAVACHPALDQEERSAAFTAEMRAAPGAVRLQVKFVLQARTRDERQWRAVAAPGFGSWNTSEPGIRRYVYTKRVENLLAPASYRAVVRFRWLSAAGKPVLRARRVTRVCLQPDLRPDLVVTRVTRTPDGYEATIANDGRTAADSFLVTVEIDGHAHQLGYVERLAAGERLRVQGQAPPCAPGSSVVVRVDADAAVDEADEHANAVSQPCPA